MQYLGGKYRQGKYIVQAILQDVANSGKQYDVWYDVFTGGGNMFFHIPATFKRYGIDADCEVIEALRHIQKTIDDLPKNSQEFTSDDYKRVKDGEGEKWLRGIAKYAYSYNKKLWGGYAKPNSKRDYIAEVYKHLKKQQKYIQDVIFVCSDYKDFTYSELGIIYADPPYLDSTTSYEYDEFDRDEFVEWLIQMKRKGHAVYFTDYGDYAEYGFKAIWEMPRKATIHWGSSRIASERLWKV